MTLREQIKRDEGRRLDPYVDCCGKSWRVCACAVKGHLTIGYGRNLDAFGITPEEAELLLDHDEARKLAAVREALPWAESELSAPRFAVLVNMAFNMGIGGLLAFKKMLAAVRAGDFPRAATEMLDSKWAAQVGIRANRLADQMRSGVWA